MGVLEKLRIGPESEEEFRSEFDAESDHEPDYEPDYESNPNIDPPPGRTAPRVQSGAKKAISQVRDAGPRITKKMRDDAQAEIQSMIEVIALGWGWQAPPCGEALEKAAPDFSEKLTRIVARNPRWLQRVRDGGLIADVIACAGALAPVAKVAAAHYSRPKEANDAHGVEFDPAAFQPYEGTGFSRAG
jgi:hypothetical protein